MNTIRAPGLCLSTLKSTASQLHNLLVFQLEQKLKMFNNLVSNLMTCLLDGPKQDVSCLLSGWIFVDFLKIITAV